MLAQQGIQQPKPGIVARISVLRTGIAQPRNQAQHKLRLFAGLGCTLIATGLGLFARRRFDGYSNMVDINHDRVVLAAELGQTHARRYLQLGQELSY